MNLRKVLLHPPLFGWCCFLLLPFRAVQLPSLLFLGGAAGFPRPFCVVLLGLSLFLVKLPATPLSGAAFSLVSLCLFRTKFKFTVFFGKKRREREKGSTTHKGREENNTTPRWKGASSITPKGWKWESSTTKKEEEADQYLPKCVRRRRAKRQ